MADKRSSERNRELITNGPVGRTLFTITLPMLYALVAIMSLGLIDSYFIGFLGTVELAAIGFILPVTSMLTSIALGLGMAISSLNSKLIGANKMASAARLITDGFYLTIAVSALVVALCVWQLEGIFKLIGATPETMPAIRSYMNIWFIGTLFLMLAQVGSSTFRSIGDTKTSAILAVVMSVLNLALDPLLIFGFGPVPALGIEGAAWATVISVFVTALIGFYLLFFREKLLTSALPSRHELIGNLSSLIEIAIPAVLANTIVPLIGAVLIAIVADFGTDAVAGFGVGMRIEAVALMVVYALSATLPMFIGQNLGANKPERITTSMRVSFRFVIALQAGIYLLLALCSTFISAAFSDSRGVQLIIEQFLLIVPISFGLCGVVILINVAMNVLGSPRVALYINLARLTVIYFPLAWLGAKVADMVGLLAGLSIGHCLAYLLACVLLRRVLKPLNISR